MDCECCRKIRWEKVLLAGVVFLVIAFIVRQVEAMLTISYYMMPQYFGLWSKLMMPNAGPPPASFMITSALFSLITGVVLAVFYECCKEMLPKKPGERTMCFTGTIAVLSIVFFSLPVYLMFNVPVWLLVSWTISTIVVVAGASMAFGKILR